MPKMINGLYIIIATLLFVFIFVLWSIIGNTNKLPKTKQDRCMIVASQKCSNEIGTEKVTDIPSNDLKILAKGKTIRAFQKDIQFPIDKREFTPDILIFADRAGERDEETYVPLLEGPMASGNMKDRKLEIIGISSRNSKVLMYSIPFPYRYYGGDIGGKIRNLVSGYSGKSYCFFNFISMNQSFLFTISLEPDYRKIIIRNFMIIKWDKFDFISYSQTYLSQYDPINNILFMNTGAFLKLGMKSSETSLLCFHSYYKAIETNLLNISGTVPVDEDRIALQVSGENVSNKLNGADNYLLLWDNASYKAKAVNDGISCANFHRMDSMSPLEITPDRKCFLYLTKYDGKDKGTWLSAWNFKEDKLIKIALLSEDTAYLSGESFIKCCPAKSSQLVAISFNGHTLLIDKSKKAIIKEIKVSSVKSMRWSPDGNELGILEYDGSLYIYNHIKDRLQMIDKDIDYFDFIWVNCGKYD